VHEAKNSGRQGTKPRIEVARAVDMSKSNSWAAFIDIFLSTPQSFLEAEESRAAL
jgi:hypothetical protein